MTWMDFFWQTLWPIIIILGQSILLLVALLIFIAYILLADRKIWAAVQMRRRRTWSGRSACCNLSPICSSSC